MIRHEEFASVGQRMLWLVDRYRGGSGRLNYPLLLRLRGRLDEAVLRRALDHLVVRHEALRTTFARRRGLLAQLVHAPEPVPVRRTTLAEGADPDGELRREAMTPIDPTVSPLRVTLWPVRDDDHLLCLNAHHLVTDAWSNRLLTTELAHLLAEREPLPRVVWQYRHFVRWQHRRSTGEQWRASEEFWRDQLDGSSPPGPWPAGAPDEMGDGGTIRLDLDGPLADRVGALARAERTTPFAVLLALFYRALWDSSGRSDLCVAAPFAGRVRPETSGTVGLFANLVMLRTRLAGSSTLLDLVRRTRDTVNAAIAHQEFPYYLLPMATSGPRADRLDDVVFQMLPELPAPIRLGDLEVEVLAPELPSRFDLELAVVPHPGGLRVCLQYARQRVADDVARRIAGHYRAAVAEVSGQALSSGPA
jgi:hypothetical protein